MKTRWVGSLAAASLTLLALAGCATPTQWDTWRSHSSHFASGQHLLFSLRNPGAEAERVRPTDPTNAAAQDWWGRTLPLATAQEGGR
jgi:hypothetical protein